MSALTTSKSSAPGRFSLGRLVWVGPLAAMVAAVANVLVFLIAKGVGVSFVLPLGPTAPAAPLPAALVIIESAIPALVATVLFALLVKFTARPALIFQVIALVFGVLSFAGPVSIPADVATKVSLGLMHIVAAVIIVGMLTRLGQQK